MTTKNLWGQIDTGMDLPAPLNILQDQASILEEITGGVLSANVIRCQDKSNFCAILEVVAPHLHNYRLGVVEIRYPFDIYPMEVSDIVPDPPGRPPPF